MPPKWNAMSAAAIERLIEQRVTESLAAQDANQSGFSQWFKRWNMYSMSATAPLDAKLRVSFDVWRMLPEEFDQVEKYVGGLPDMIQGNVVCYAENDARSNRNIARAYTVGPGEKKEYLGTLPLIITTMGCALQVRVTKVIKGEFEKIKDIKVEDDSLPCDSPLEFFNCKVSRLSKIDDDLFTYEVEIANIPCDLRVDDDSEHEADDMGFDPSDIAFTEWLGSKFFNYKTMDHYTMKALWIYWIRGDDEVELTDEEFSDNEDEIAEVFRIDTNIFDYETPICSAFNEFNYLLKFGTETERVIHTCKPFNYKNGCSEWPTCSWMNDGYCNGGNLPGTFIIENQLHYQDYEWYKALEDSELKDEALRNKAIMEGFIKDDDDESSYEQMRRWDIYTNYDDTYKKNHDDNEREELCEVHEPPVCMIQRFEMIKYSFGQGEEYVVIKEDEYDDLARTSNNACRTYQEIFRMMDEGWKDLVKEISTNIGGEFTNLEILKSWSFETSRRLFNTKSCS
ncbi:hypothetical protein Tco_0281378 [Tanacetum coccineum]